jgi:hypothetical protein
VKVLNVGEVETPLQVRSPQALAVANAPAGDVEKRWLDLDLSTARPLNAALSGLALEYRVLNVYSRDTGARDATLEFNAFSDKASADWSSLTLSFQAEPSSTVTFEVLDENGQPATAAFVIRDAAGRVYPAQTKRLAPDFFFHQQIYRSTGETVRLPRGSYTVQCSRGPESIPESRELVVDTDSATFRYQVQRWVDPALLGWYSGDHHIHAAGCAHYTNPTEGVFPPDMARHCLGEDLKVGCALTWGPCFDFQKQFFTGKEDPVSKYPYLIRYDIEVSGFGSHQSGHLCLLRLKDQMYPGGTSSKHWPTLCLNTLRWAKKQGAVCGPAHSGWGLGLQSETLPNYEIPPFDSIGAMEYIVDVTHLVPGPDGKPVPAVDFLSHGDTPYVWEHNIWYHTLNAGFRTRISGETDFPCIYGERVGLGRSYVKLEGKLDYDAWCEGIRWGRAYVSDGRSHLMDFKVGGLELGAGTGELRLDAPGKVAVSAKVSAMLAERPDRSIRPYGDVIGRAGGQGSRWAAELKPFWHVERARIGDSRDVKVEMVVNGYPVASKVVKADGDLRDVAFDVPVERSSWVALRILGTSHTNPIFIEVGGKPIRASRRSVEWCQKSVERLWTQKERHIGAAEKQDAIEAYEHARQVYRKLLAECEVE